MDRIETLRDSGRFKAMFKKILVANRGEIALRVIRACRDMGIQSVAVYSEADRDSLHARFADQAYCIGPPPSSESYLNIPRLISAAEITDAEAIHPGYGFLAENAHFAEICESCNIRFIGPTPESIRMMGEKSRARQVIKGAGIAIIPGSDGELKSQEEAIELARKIGYPVMLKAVGGGGGRGMRVAHTDVSLAQAYNMATREADSAFGNPALYLEKHIEKPRHIEFQILADSYGNIVHLGERDCTLQRRHQKLVEESPSPVLSRKLRDKMARTAIKCAKAANYSSAGTVEFLFDQEGRYYFLEMNTRIQVEHPVTEVCTGLDLVKEQIRIAAGEPLGYKQDDIQFTGHAIECRINAEDATDNFRPCPGKLDVFNIPGGIGIRVDTHAYTEYIVPQYYDSLLAKIIAFGKTRREAINRMLRALEEFVVIGVPTTIPFHQKILADRHFMSGRIHTEFVDEYLSGTIGSQEKV
jgi:acetyl-CoA carboxylase biotin carboxylase subunit